MVLFVVDMSFMSILLGEMWDEWACKKKMGSRDLLVANLLQTGHEQHNSNPRVFLPLKNEFLERFGLDANQLAGTLQLSAHNHKRKQLKD